MIPGAITPGMMAKARGARIAHVQDQAVALPLARASGWRTLRGRGTRGEGLDRADLGGGVIKPHARQGQGRSGGFRVIVAFRRGDRAFFVHGFAKSERENLRPRELTALRSLADEMLGLDDAGLEAMLANGTISEVNCDDQAV